MELSNKISTATLARTAVLLLALTNQVLSAMGKPVLPIESTTVEQLVTAGITTVAALISWWKNNSFTAAAVAADSYMARLKQKQCSPTALYKVEGKAPGDAGFRGPFFVCSRAAGEIPAGSLPEIPSLKKWFSATIRTLCTSTATASFHVRNSFSFFCNKFL